MKYKDYELKDCKEVKTSTFHTKHVPDCKKVTKNNCVTDWEVDSNGNKVWTGTETCTPVTWEECVIVEKQVEFPSVETECNTVANIKWADFVEKTKDAIGLETTCEVIVRYILIVKILFCNFRVNSFLSLNLFRLFFSEIVKRKDKAVLKI